VTSETQGTALLSTHSEVGGTVKAVVEYDGTQYFGFQIQPGRPTIQGELEAALHSVTSAAIRIVGGGRTDAGVHALGQVISFPVEWNHPLEDLQNALNANLPQDIVVKGIAAAADGFHARYSAKGRHYRYLLFSGRVRAPLLERYAWRVGRDLSLERLQAASDSIVGEHDFGAFGESPSGDSTVRAVLSAQWRREGHLLVWDVTANAFLRRMVRTLVGTMVWVAAGRLSPESFEGLLGTPDRSAVAPPAPPNGLCLVEVLY